MAAKHSYMRGERRLRGWSRKFTAVNFLNFLTGSVISPYHPLAPCPCNTMLHLLRSHIRTRRTSRLPSSQPSLPLQHPCMARTVPILQQRRHHSTTLALSLPCRRHLSFRRPGIPQWGLSLEALLPRPRLRILQLGGASRGRIRIRILGRRREHGTHRVDLTVQVVTERGTRVTRCDDEDDYEYPYTDGAGWEEIEELYLIIEHISLTTCCFLSSGLFEVSGVH